MFGIEARDEERRKRERESTCSDISGGFFFCDIIYCVFVYLE